MGAVKRRMNCGARPNRHNGTMDSDKKGDEDSKKMPTKRRWIVALLSVLGVVVLLASYGEGVIPTEKLSRKSKTISSKRGGSFCKWSNRCRPMQLLKAFSFIHISKCAGTSWLQELHKVLPQLQPKEASGEEYTVQWTMENLPSDYLLLSLKSPRHHVWSLFSQCKYSPFGIDATEGLDFPRSGETPEADEKDFDEWLKFFEARLPLPQTDCFLCYDPSNYQSQHMAGLSRDQRCNPPSVSPRVETIVENYWKMDWVGISEFYHESKCLLYYRIRIPREDKKYRFTIPEARQTIDKYLAEECVCPHAESSSDIHFVHHDKGRRSSMADLPKSTLDRIERLTMADTLLYKLALAQFMDEIAWLESKQQLGRRVMCNDQLAKQEPKLHYTGINVTDAYLSAVAQANNGRKIKRLHRLR